MLLFLNSLYFIPQINMKNENYTKWVHWPTTYGRKAAVTTFQNINALMLSKNKRFVLGGWTVDKWQTMLKPFVSNYAKNIEAGDLLWGAADIFYIPQKMSKEYMMASYLLRKSYLFVELAIPLVHLGLAPKEDVVYLQGNSLWSGRRHPQTYFNPLHMYLHPFKLSDKWLNNTNRRIKFFCDAYLPKIDDMITKGYERHDFKIADQ